MRKFTLCVAAVASLSTVASAQPNFNRPPTFGTINLSSGFANDPRVINVTAGGRLDASTIDSDCHGSVADRPDVRLNYEAGSLPLIISADSSEDATLAVNGPDGSWYCDDDSGNAPLNPMVRFNDPASGRYEIWIGTFSDTAIQPARLHISELTSQ